MGKKWYKQRAGIVTVSKAKRVFNARLEKGSRFSILNLVEDITVLKCTFQNSSKVPGAPTNSQQWGLVHEDSARKAYYKIENKKHHKLKLVSKGVLICKSKPMIGASVHNIRTCKCLLGCPDAVVKYKCPWKHSNRSAKDAFLTPGIGGRVVDVDIAMS